MNQALSCLVLILALTAGCTKENAAFCCIDAADCAAQGVQEGGRLCTDGLSCVDNKCVASTCASSGCASTAPVCEIATDVCVGCTDSTECMRFGATDVCDMTSGACVECASATDCDAAKPVCDASACRTCKLDSECPSGACAEDGTCVSEPNVVYLSPTGTDALPCSLAQPCLQLRFAVQQLNSGRTHIVFAPGNYTLFESPLYIDSQSAPRIGIHGHGAILTGGSTDGFLVVGTAATIEDLEIVNPSVGDSNALRIAGSAILERVSVRGGHDGLAVAGQATATDLRIHATNIGIFNSGSVILNRARIEAGTSALVSFQGNVDITNVLSFGTSGIAIDLMGTSGRIAFSTIFSTASGTDPAGVRCASAGVTLLSSIVWTPTPPTPRTGVTGCILTTSIVGPVGVAGAMSTDPLFVNVGLGDFHLSGGSPARDAVDSGPSIDFDGDMRPRSARFDIGADEAP